MTTTPTIWKSSTKVNTTEAGTQVHGGLAALLDGGYVVVWTDDSNGVFNPTGDAVVAQRYERVRPKGRRRGRNSRLTITNRHVQRPRPGGDGSSQREHRYRVCA